MTASLFPIRCRGLLFDMDNTLLDSRLVVERHWKIWCEENGVDYESLISVSHGRPSFEILKEFAPAHRQEEYQTPAYIAKLEYSVSSDVNGVVLIPGAKDLLKSLPTSCWAVVTSAGHDMAVQRFKQTGLSTPPVLVTASHVKFGKPHPQPYLMAAEQLGISPKDCVVFEDAPAGVRSGVASGAQAVIGMDTGTVHRDELVAAGALTLIKNFEELEFSVTSDGWIEISQKQKSA